MVDDGFSRIISLTNSAIENARALVQECKEYSIGSFPEYKDIKSKDVLYSKYGEASRISYKYAASLSTLFQMRDALRKFKKEIARDGSYPPSISAQYRSEVDYMLSRFEDVIPEVKIMKEGVDAMVKFYASTQYILGSSRLDGFD